jgi:putative ABC transport system ATP-binding protein
MTMSDDGHSADDHDDETTDRAGAMTNELTDEPSDPTMTDEPSDPTEPGGPAETAAVDGPTEALYELHGIRRVYRTGAGELAALDDVSLRIGAGEFVAIEGPSGSGKSTLLQLLGALDRPTSGSLLFDARELASMGEGELTRLRSRSIGFVFQSFNLIPTLTAVENVEVAMVPVGGDRGARRSRALELLEMVGLAARATHLPSRLSGGEQQRVAIARALANEPRVILADEPTGNLDTATAEDVVAILRSLADRGVTVIIVTHAGEVAAATSRRIRLRDGRVADDSAAVAVGADNPFSRSGT